MILIFKTDHYSVQKGKPSRTECLQQFDKTELNR